MDEWVKCENCNTQITKKTAEEQNGLCTECRVKELFENLGGGTKDAAKN